MDAPGGETEGGSGQILPVARENNKDDEKVKEFVQSFQTDEVFKKGTELFKGGLVKGW